ncbi:SseB family protein [Paracoccus sp. Z118]|uniref:SseB family protein n=1 Tax=Paracoccus sp. Z118 TaxID=2851017 RepID=UPI00352FF1C4
MTARTALDRLCTVPFHEADESLRAQVLRRLADTELFAALSADPQDDLAKLMLFDLEGTQAALACDDAAELAAFVGGPVAHAAMPGRVLAATLAEEGRALLVNPGRPSQMLLDAGALAWLGQALAQKPAEGQGTPARLTLPDADMVSVLADPLAERLAAMGDLLSGAALARAEWADGAAGHLLMISGASQGDQAAIAKAVGEMLAFLPPVPGGLDITFEGAALPAGALRLELTPAPPAEPEPEPEVDRPPKLRW